MSVKKFGQSCARVADVKKGGENITNGGTTNGNTKEHVNSNGYVNGDVNANGPNLGMMRFFNPFSNGSFVHWINKDLKRLFFS